jgi:hypothetical protein
VIDDKCGNKISVVLAKSVGVCSIPAKSGVIRVDDYLQSCGLTTNGAGGTKGENSDAAYPGRLVTVLADRLA